MGSSKWGILVFVLGTTGFCQAQVQDRPRYEKRWFYVMLNLQVEANADRLVDLIGQAKSAGYNGLVLADYKLNVLDRVPEFYFPNVERVKAAAKEAGIEIIPAVFPIGYSSGLLAHDPNLAEGIESETRFRVHDGRLVLQSDPSTQVKNGGFEDARNDHFAGFGFQDDPGRATVQDDAVAHSGKNSCRMRDTDPKANSRVIQSVPVRPKGCYRLSAWVKTQGLKRPGGFRLLAMGKNGRSLTFFEGGLKPDMDWTRLSVVFNALDQTEVNLYAGLWGGSPGTLWMDDLKIEEIGLTNVLRREGCPVTVSSKDGKTRYEEGRDVSEIVDPDLGRVPYLGEFDFDHEAPMIRVPAGSRLKGGDEVEISWYHPILVHGSQVACCLTEPKVYDLLRDQAERVEKLFHPKTIFMSHDELRFANWCRACQERNMTAGELLADNVRRCVEILHEVSPDAEAVVWSDMFDPNHNAVDRYYLVNGTLEGSWKGLPESVIVANWNGGHMRASLEFFAKRGHRQVIAGYYDGDSLENFRKWDEAAAGLPGVLGFLYTTWRGDYHLLSEYGKAMRKP